MAIYTLASLAYWVAPTIEVLIVARFFQALGGCAATVLPLMVLYMVGLGIMMPNALAGMMAPFPERAGAATAFQGFTQFAMAAVVGIAVTEMYDRSALPMAIGITAMGMQAVVFCFRLREED